jgi:uncharacterized cupredoxin-like copper-binding protein
VVEILGQSRRDSRGGRAVWLGLAVAGFLLLAFSISLVPAVPARSTSGAAALVVHPSAEVVYLNVSATELATFLPDQISAPVGSLIHLKVLQMADFNHTFVLASAANFTFPSADTSTQLLAYFATHTPLVNLSLGLTPGENFYANFTAPGAGVYEFVCVEPLHFSGGMHGTLTTTTPGSTPSPASSSPFSTTVILVIVVIVVLVIVAAVAMMAMRRRKSPPATGSPPPAA